MASKEQSPIPSDTDDSISPSKHLVLGDDGKPVAVNLSPQQAKAGLEALDALLKLPSIKPDTPLFDIVEALSEQIPIIEEKTSAMEAVRKGRRDLVIKGGAILAATTIGFTTLPSIGSGLVRWGQEITASKGAADLAHTLGGTNGAVSLPSKENWRVKYLPEDPEARYVELSDKKQSLGFNDTIKIDDKNTGIVAQYYQLVSSGKNVAALGIRDTGNNIKPVYLPPNPIPGLDTRVVVFENVADGTQKYFSIGLAGSGSYTRLEIKEMQRLSSGQTASR